MIKMMRLCDRFAPVVHYAHYDLMLVLLYVLSIYLQMLMICANANTAEQVCAILLLF